MNSIPKATIILSNQCNLNCSYCFVGKDVRSSLTLPQIKAFIKWFIDLPTKENRKKLSFLGGEPFLDFDLLKEAIKFFKKHNINKTSVIDTIPTNGTILTSEILDFVKKENLNISFSLDGDQISNSVRKFQNGEDSFDQIWNNLIKFRDHMGEPPLVKMTVLPSNVHNLHSNVKFLVENGFYNTWPNPGVLKVTWTQKNTDIFIHQYEKLLKFYLKIRLLRKSINLVPVDQLLEEPEKGTDIFCCGLGQEPILFSDANIYTCTSALSGTNKLTNRFKVGAIVNNKVQVDLNKMHLFLKESIFNEYNLRNKNHILAHTFKKRFCFCFDENGNPLKKEYVENLLEIHIKIYEMVLDLFRKYNHLLK